MLCEKCGKRNATVMYTQIVNGQKSSLNICSQCAAGESIFDNFGSLLSFESRENSPNTVCPCCTMTLAEFMRKGRAGCGKCYETFRIPARNMLQKIHGTAKHMAESEPIKKAQEQKAPVKSELDILRDKLAEAILQENFEEAAAIRDSIREKEGKNNG